MWFDDGSLLDCELLSFFFFPFFFFLVMNTVLTHNFA